MTITRPYGAEDNRVNTAQTEIITRYCKKIGEEVDSLEIYECAVVAVTKSNNTYIANISENSRAMSNISKYTYLKQKINGKQIRIPKTEW